MTSRSYPLLRCALAVACLAAAGCGSVTGKGAGGPATPPPVASSSAPPTPPAPASGAPVALCQPSRLKITAVKGGPAAGNVGLTIGFANEGHVTCSLAGWPRVAGITAGGARATAQHTLTTMFGPSNLTTPPTVVLRPGSLAEAVVAGGDVPQGQDSTCPPAYTRLAISPPGGGGATVVSGWVPYLAAYLPSCVPIEVTPVVAAQALGR